MLPKIIAITINWNGYKETVDLIESFKKVTYTNLEIIVVDNNSQPEEVEKLKSSIGNSAQLIILNENTGFAGGNNIGIAEAIRQYSDFILIINNDTIVEPDFLEFLVKKIETDDNVGIVAPRINYYDQPNKIWTDGGKIKRIRGSGFAYSDKLESEVEQTDKEVSFVSGCCLLIKKEVFLNVGLFDENYFLYNEDTDFCLRTLKAGFRIYVIPQSKIYHKVNRSTEKKLPLLPLYYTTRNRLYFVKKNFPATFVLYFFVHLYEYVI